MKSQGKQVDERGRGRSGGTRQSEGDDGEKVATSFGQREARRHGRGHRAIIVGKKAKLYGIENTNQKKNGFGRSGRRISRYGPIWRKRGGVEEIRRKQKREVKFLRGGRRLERVVGTHAALTSGCRKTDL